MIGALLRRSWLVLAALAAATAVLGTLALGLPLDFSLARLYAAAGPEREAYERFRSEFGSDDALLYAAFPSPATFDAETLDRVRDLQARLARVPDVRSTFGAADALATYRGLPADPRAEVSASPLFRGTLFSADGRTGALWIALRPDLAGAEDRRRAVEAVRAELARTPGMEFHLSGLPVVENEYVELTKRDLSTFMPIAAGLFLVLLAAHFRSAAGALLPLVTVAIAIVWTLGAMRLAGLPMGLLTSLVPNLILVLGISDGVHLLSRHLEDLRDLPGKREALARTLRLMVPACFLTSFTTAVGFSSLLTAPVPAVREFGLAAGGGVLIACAVTVLFLGAALDRLPAFRGRALEAFASRFWDRLLGAVARANERRPMLVALAGVALAGVSVAGLLRVRRESSWLHDLRADHPVHRAHRFFEERLGGVFTLDLRLDGPVERLEWLREVEAFQGELSKLGVAAVGFPDLVKELAFARPRRLPRTQEEYQGTLALARRLFAEREPAVRLADASMGSCRIVVRMRGMTSMSLSALGRDLEALGAKYRDRFRLTVTGKTWLAKRAMDRVIDSMLSTLGLAGIVIFGSMALLFRSLAVGFLSIVPNVLPMLFTAGFMGWAGIDLNFSTVTIFSISLGIAVDTTIHYLARLKLELGRDSDPREAMRRAVRGAGGPMIFATTLLVVGFGAILTSNFVFTFHFGLLGGVALLSALFCDLFVTPTLFLAFRPRLRALERSKGV